MKYNVPKYQICYTLWLSVKIYEHDIRKYQKCYTLQLSVKHKIYLLTTRHIINLFSFEISWIVTVTCTIEKLRGGALKGAMNPLLHKAQNYNQYRCP